MVGSIRKAFFLRRTWKPSGDTAAEARRGHVPAGGFTKGQRGRGERAPGRGGRERGRRPRDLPRLRVAHFLAASGGAVGLFYEYDVLT